MVDDEFNCDLDEKEFSQTKGSKFNELKSEQPMDEILPSGFTSATWYQAASRMDTCSGKKFQINMSLSVMQGMDLKWTDLHSSGTLWTHIILISKVKVKAAARVLLRTASSSACTTSSVDKNSRASLVQPWNQSH